MRFPAKWKARLGSAAAALAVLALIASYSPGWFAGQRPPTEHETILYYFAEHIGETALCDRISWAAYQSYSVLFGGGGASRFRSDCYERVAEVRHDSAICGDVRPLLDLNPLSGGYSALSCWRRTESGYMSGIGLPDELLIGTFQRMGYDIDRMQVEGVMPPAIRKQDAYRRLEHDNVALAAAKALLTHPDPSMRGDDRSLLAHLVAVASGAPAWCDHIPAGQYVSGVTAAPFRDWCYFTLAVDSQDIRICERMTPVAMEVKVREALAAGVRPEIAEQMGLHGQCVKSRDYVGARPHYGPQEPSDDEQTLRLLKTLGVAIPSVHDWPAADIANYFRQYIFALAPGKTVNPARDRARADLVRRLLALPAQL